MNSASESFLIDSNSFITPYASYYPFDFAVKFWGQLKNNIENGSIIILDMVKNEIEKGNDRLSEWMKEIEIASLIDHREGEILKEYANVLTYIQKADTYNSRALAEWSKIDVADPWLIATAKLYGYTIITFERPVGNLSSKSPCARPKIPDICTAFDVNYADLFYMMRKLSFGF